MKTTAATNKQERDPPPKKNKKITTTTNKPKTRKSQQWIEQLDNRDSERLKGTPAKQCNI